MALPLPRLIWYLVRLGPVALRIGAARTARRARLQRSSHARACACAMNRVKEVERINSKDLKLQLASDAAGNAGRWNVESSWHGQYKDSAYVYVGGLDVGLTEGDVAVVFSQLGEVVDVHLPRDKKTGKPRGFAFVGYEDQRSTVLAVDNFNGAKLLGRTLRCDHCAKFHEEQEKDPDQLPEHVRRKLSEQELERKRQDIVRRNAELAEESAAKAESFAVGRGTAETDEEAEERMVRAQLHARKEESSTAARRSHIESVLARRKGDASAEIAAEKRRQQQWEERRKQRAEAKGGRRRRRRGARRLGRTTRRCRRRRRAAAAAAAPRTRAQSGPPSARRRSGPRRAGDGGAAAAGRAKKVGEDAISVDETNELREKLGRR